VNVRGRRARRRRPRDRARPGSTQQVDPLQSLVQLVKPTLQIRRCPPRLLRDSEVESFSSVSEQRAKRRPIEAQSTAIARAMASICNDERASFGVMSGHDRKTLNLSGGLPGAIGQHLMDVERQVGNQPIVVGRQVEAGQLAELAEPVRNRLAVDTEAL
jgi:hypothetical protein